MPDINTIIIRDYLEANETYNNDDTLNDTALSVTVAASTKYKVELVGSQSSITRGLNFDFGGTATITNFAGVWESFDPSNIGGTHFSVKATTAGTDFSDPGSDGLEWEYRFVGSVEINAAGTFLLRAAQRIADASNTVLLRGATLILTKMD